MIFISSLIFSADVIISKPNDITQYEVSDINFSLNENLNFEVDGNRLFIPSQYFEELTELFYQVDEYFSNTLPRKGYTIIQERRFNDIQYLLVVSTTSRIQISLENYKLHIYWQEVKSYIQDLIGE